VPQELYAVDLQVKVTRTFPLLFSRTSDEVVANVVGAGKHGFEKPALDAYRDAVVDAKLGRALEVALDEVRRAGEHQLGGTTRKTVPSDFDAGHARAGLLLHESLWVGRIGETGGLLRARALVGGGPARPREAPWAVQAGLIRSRGDRCV
jgi:hypothetical protein